jgi:cardiolipin synthase A/B
MITGMTTLITAIVTILVYLFYLSVFLYLIYLDRDPATTAFWAIIIFLFPGLGLLAFFFFGLDWRSGTKKSLKERKISRDAIKRFMPRFYQKYMPFNNKFLKANKDSWLSRLVLANQVQDMAPVLPADSVIILPSGKLGFDSLKKDMEAAQKSIHMEFFIWEKDELTEELMEILLERMAHKVEVRIKYDFLGSIAYGKSELRKLKKAGAQVYADITDINRFNYRNHRKIAVIDGLVGYTGGINIGQEYIDGGKHYPHWRDTFVRVTGPIVADLQKVFASRWILVSKENLYKAKYFPAQDIKRGAIPAQLNYSSSDYYWSTARDSYLLAILSAKKRIYIQSPYFIPDQALYAALETAALSGVDVKLLMTGWPDKKSAWWAAQTFFERLLKAGMEINYYEEGFMHAKTLLVDDNFTSIGSTNFDVRSFTLQKEDSMFFFDEGVNNEHARIYTNDLKKCRQFTLKDYVKLTRIQKLRNSLSKLLSNLF